MVPEMVTDLDTNKPEIFAESIHLHCRVGKEYWYSHCKIGMFKQIHITESVYIYKPFIYILEKIVKNRSPK